MKKAYGMTVLMLLLTTVLSLGWATEGSARPGDLATFNSTYDTAGTRLDSCLVCHVDGSDLNPFGMDISMQTGTTGQRLANVEVLDSDGDGFSNIDEINNLTFPGDPDDNPAVGPEAAPDGLAALSFAIAVIIALFAILSAAAYLASRMKEANLRKWHRYAGVILAPLIVLQALSGIFLS
ncbi:MAG: hypothetical protein IBX61_05240, partial [Thermoleophilia bacterium]|nr:hypothetical protein [Thermoleophilia bacterium]